MFYMTAEKTKRTDLEQPPPFFLRRFPIELRSRLEQQAKVSERSLTAEILVRLRNSLKADEAAA
jgi:hypothetical protein